MVDATARLAPRHLDQLRRSCGEVITPDDAAYDDARRLWNAIHDRRPGGHRPPDDRRRRSPTAVRFARDHDLEIAVQSGGHSAAGLAGADGGLVVDLSAMRGVEVDPRTRIARANGGALLGELDVAAQAHGLVCPIGVVGHTGVAGLTLGGGVGRLQRHFGLTIDNLAAVELVTADGRLVRASETEEPELFWGLRGAGWNFGIATAFEFRLQPFGPDLHRGVLTFPATQVQELWDHLPRLRAERARRGVGDLRHRPGGDRTPATRTTWSASRSSTSPGTTAARPTTSSATRPGFAIGPTPLTTTIGSAPYLEVQTAHDLAFAWGSRSFIKSHNANDVRPEALDELVELVATAPGEGTFSVTALGGAIGRVPEDATAYAGRAAAFDLSADSSWTDPAARRGEHRLVPAGDGRRRAGPDPRRLRERQQRRRPRGDAPDLRRRQARPPRRPQARRGTPTTSST